MRPERLELITAMAADRLARERAQYSENQVYADRSHVALWFDERVHGVASLTENQPHPAFEVYGALRRELRRMGFYVTSDHRAMKRGRYARGRYHVAGRGRLRCTLKLSRWIKIDFYPDHNPDNRHGPRYGICTKDALLERDLKTSRLLRWTVVRLLIFAKQHGFREVTEPVWHDPEERLEWWNRWEWRWHWKGEPSIWVPRQVDVYNAKDRNGQILRCGDVKCMYGRYGGGGPLGIGHVFHGGNNMWFMITGGELRRCGSHELFDWRSNLPRRWFPIDHRRKRLQRLLSEAVGRQDFERAIVLRDVMKRLDPKPERSVVLDGTTRKVAQESRVQ